MYTLVTVINNIQESPDRKLNLNVLVAYDY